MYALDYIAAWEHFVLIGSQANGIVMSVLWSLSFVRGLEKKLPPPHLWEHTASSEQWTSRLGFILPAASASLIPVHSIYETAKCESTHLPLKCSWPSLP